ncbi:MAG: hypothetical protein ACI83D_000433, partial [Planctomycetota bacterium]
MKYQLMLFFFFCSLAMMSSCGMQIVQHESVKTITGTETETPEEPDIFQVSLNGPTLNGLLLDSIDTKSYSDSIISFLYAASIEEEAPPVPLIHTAIDTFQEGASRGGHYWVSVETLGCIPRGVAVQRAVDGIMYLDSTTIQDSIWRADGDLQRCLLSAYVQRYQSAISASLGWYRQNKEEYGLDSMQCANLKLL